MKLLIVKDGLAQRARPGAGVGERGEQDEPDREEHQHGQDDQLQPGRQHPLERPHAGRLALGLHRRRGGCRSGHGGGHAATAVAAAGVVSTGDAVSSLRTCAAFGRDPHGGGVAGAEPVAGLRHGDGLDDGPVLQGDPVADGGALEAGDIDVPAPDTGPGRVAGSGLGHLQVLGPQAQAGRSGAGRDVADRQRHRVFGQGGDVLVAVLGDGAREDVAHAEEVGDRLGRRGGVDLLRGADLHDPAALHQRDPVGEGEGLDLVVGDVHGGQVQVELDLAEFDPQPLPEPGVQVGQRLVEQQHAGLHDQAAGQCDALHLPTGELAGATGFEIRQADDGEGLADPLGGFLLRDLLHLQREPDVLEDGAVRPHGVGLEDHPDVALVGGDADPAFGVVDDGVADGDPAAAGLFQPGDAAHRAGLAATGLAEQDQRFAVGDLQVQLFHHRIAAVLQAQVFEGDLHWSSSPTRRLHRDGSAGTGIGAMTGRGRQAWSGDGGRGVAAGLGVGLGRSGCWWTGM